MVTRRSFVSLRMTCCLLGLFAVVAIFSACKPGGEGTTIVNNTTSDAAPLSITIGKLQSDGTSAISAPLEVFGDDESDLDGATIDVSVTRSGGVDLTTASPQVRTLALTGGSSSGSSSSSNNTVDAEDAFNSETQAVEFVVTSLEDGDALIFAISLANTEEEIIYEGEVSSEEDSEAFETDS